MPNTPELIEAPDTPNFAPRLWGIAAIVCAIVFIGMFLVARFAEVDLARDMHAWQEKLNLIAESRTAEVSNWVGDHFKELRKLADNPSMQLYLSELEGMKNPGHAAKASEPDTEPAQKAYLRNLLVFTAERAGFAPASSVAAIPANVQPESRSGLAVLNMQNDIVVSTAMQSSTRDLILDSAKYSAPGQEGLIDIRRDSDGTIYIGFISPIFSIQGERNAASQIGRVIGIKTVDSNLFSLLKHPGTTEHTLESILVRPIDDKLEYISPLQDGSTALSKQSPNDPNKYAEARLVQTIGSFSSDQKDYRDKVVLATSRAITGTPWILEVKIDRQEALAESEQRRASMITFFFLIIAIIVLIIIAIWWHAHSKRSMLMSSYFQRLASWATAQEQLLRLVADNQPEPIYIVDQNQVYQFANQKTGDESGMSPESIIGKTLADVRGAARAEIIGDQCTRALRQKQVVYDVQNVPQDGESHVIRSAYVPLAHIPVVTLPDDTPGVQVVEQDISEIVHEREQRLETQRQLVHMLVRLVDKRDPFAANHSQLVAQVAYAVAADMELDAVTVETTRTAGILMNIGKIVVPTELLTKTDSMTPEEKRAIRDSMNASADLLGDIRFDGPVAETLRQWQEKWDGSGPLGLKGEHILISARIIAVANAFIGMISPRSWRNAMTIEAASKQLLEQSRKQFDQRVVIALVNYIENHSGKAWLKKAIDSKKSVA